MFQRHLAQRGWAKGLEVSIFLQLDFESQGIGDLFGKKKKKLDIYRMLSGGWHLLAADALLDRQPKDLDRGSFLIDQTPRSLYREGA